MRRRTSTVSMVVLQGGLVHQDKHLLILGMVPCAHESMFDHTGVTDEFLIGFVALRQQGWDIVEWE